MARRVAAPGLALVALGCSLAGAGGPGSLVLLAAIVAGAVRLLDAVGDAAEGRGERFSVVVTAAGLVCLVAAGAARIPLLVVGLLVCSGLEVLARAEAPAPLAAAEPVELSRAA